MPGRGGHIVAAARCRRLFQSEVSNSSLCCEAFLQPVLQTVWGHSTFVSAWIHRRVDDVVCGQSAAVHGRYEVGPARLGHALKDLRSHPM